MANEIRPLRPCMPEHKECFGFDKTHKILGVPLCDVCQTRKNGH